MVGVVASKEMGHEEASSLAVDCTLSLGSTMSRTMAETPAASRLSRAGSPDPDLALSLSVRSEPRRALEQSDQDVSWGSSCIRSDSDATPEYYPQVSERGARVGDGVRSFKAWPRSYKDEVTTSKALFGVVDDHKYVSSRASRQPWLPKYLPSSAVVKAKVASRADPCMQQEGDSFVRVCAHCGTSKTPLWRNGPGGPKSLCNACGIRFKKAGRRSAANGGADSPPATTKVAKRKLSEEQQYWMFPADAKPRKRSRGAAVRTSDSLLSGSCMTWQSSLLYSPKSPLQRDFPASPESQEKKDASFSSDEEEGAVLLMALSCGMVNA